MRTIAEFTKTVDVPFTVALKVFSKWGTGAGEFVRAMQRQKIVAESLIAPKEVTESI